MGIGLLLQRRLHQYRCHKHHQYHFLARKKTGHIVHSSIKLDTRFHLGSIISNKSITYQQNLECIKDAIHNPYFGTVHVGEDNYPWPSERALIREVGSYRLAYSLPLSPHGCHQVLIHFWADREERAPSETRL